VKHRKAREIQHYMFLSRRGLEREDALKHYLGTDKLQ
jgi:hypothetical protein